MPKAPAPTKAMKEQAKRVTILRDKWGVPHVFGKSDADAAFGLAYAHAEDDFRLIQLALAAATGRLSLLILSEQAIGNDFYVSLIGVKEQLDKQYKKLSPQVRAVLEGYAKGLSYYAGLHPNEADGRLFPVTGRDVAAGFIHKIPLMFNLPKVLSALNSAKTKKVGDKVFASDSKKSRGTRLAAFSSQSFQITGSNTHAVLGRRFTDGITRLNVNSHQPWEGPVTWYEAHVSSEEGWNMLGGTFPGAPFILHGHNDHLGWAHTNNHPDLIDVYKLKMNIKVQGSYKLDKKWKRLKERTAAVKVDTGLFYFTYRMKSYYTEHGPVFKTPHGYYAIRYAGIDKAIFAVEQWFKMNKAKNLKEWKDAMRIQAIPMFNTNYADKDNIFYVYNALLPQRKPGFDYKKILPGHRSDLIWKTYLPWDKLPQVHNPTSGFVQNCNATPFRSTVGKDNPKASLYPKEAGIETYLNNRTIRSLQLLSKKAKLTRADFLKMKFDRFYDKKAPIFKTIIQPLLASYKPQNQDEKKGFELLKSWDGSTHIDNRAAALAILTRHPLRDRFRRHRRGQPKTPQAAFQAAVKMLKKYYNRVDVPLGQVQRLRRGKVDLAIDGGPDIITAVESKLIKGKLVGYQGDSYILIAEFAKDGIRSYSRHQYGNSNRKTSKHYADQAPYFVKRKLKRIYRSKEQLLKNKAKAYHPGEKK